jgi:hypothetical protein
MTRVGSALIRLVAIVSALLFGWVIGMLRFIDVWPPPSGGAVAVSVAAMTALGLSLQLGLFLSPSSTRRQPRYLAVVGLLMAPATLGLSILFAGAVREILEAWPALFARVPGSDWLQFGVFSALLGLYVGVYVVLWNAYRRRRGQMAASPPG